MARLKFWLMGLVAVITLAGAVPMAQAQVVVRVGPHHRHYHHRYYRHHRHYR